MKMTREIECLVRVFISNSNWLFILFVAFHYLLSISLLLLN